MLATAPVALSMRYTPLTITTDDLPLVVAGVTTLVAAATDLWRFKVYNLLTLPTLTLGLVVAATHGGWPGLQASLLGAGFGFGILLALHALGGVGAGDVKLLAALGAWLGLIWTVHVFIASALAAGVYAVVLVLVQRGVLGVVIEFLLASGPADLAAEVQRPDRRRRLVPFAAMTCVGFFVVLGWWRTDLGSTWPIAPHPEHQVVVASARSAPSHPSATAVEDVR